MKVLVVGSNGKIGSILIRKLTEDKEWQPTAMIRKESQKPKFNELGVPVILADLENSVDELRDVVAGFDAVVFTAGSGGSTGADKTLLVDLDGAVKMVEAAESQEVSRFVMVSALGASSRDRWNESIKPYYVAKYYADKALINSSLNYTIIRPGRLLDEEETGKIEIGEEVDRASIPRADVAGIIVEVLHRQNTIGKTFDVVSGHTAISDSVKTL